jgi:mannose-6-phosphate isomerase class I
MLVPYEMALLASSDPTAGSQNLSADGSSFEVQLQEAIEIPTDAESITIEAQEAAVWFTTANIKTRFC